MHWCKKSEVKDMETSQCHRLKAATEFTPGDSMVRLARRGYLASLAHVDDEIGKILKTLERLGLERRTIVALFSDHGFSLGQSGYYGKHNLFENVLRGAGKTT